jgi:hypothetical protein
MSEESSSQRPKSKIAFATIRMPDGKEHEIPLAPKTFSVRVTIRKFPHLFTIMKYMVDRSRFGRKVKRDKKPKGLYTTPILLCD